MSRMNRNANYVHVVDGETIWERLRVIRNFLIDRRQALQLAKLDLERQDSLDQTSFAYKEAVIMRPQQLELIQECESEIEFLEKFEARLAQEAEKSRIPGKTDDEMYELNFFEEMRLRLVKEAQAEMFAHGSITAQTMKQLLRHKPALESCVALGFLTENILDASAAHQQVLAQTSHLAIPFLEACDA